MSVLPEIIAWSRERPLWQQDALRRLIEQPKLSAADQTDLVALCKAEAGLDTVEVEPARPLDAAHQPDSHGPMPVVRLTKVHSVKNVNVLRDDQALSIAPSGLTLVYGDNGAGKSGYVRVLKQICRARGARDAVHPNVYADAAGPASAKVCYELNNLQVNLSSDLNGTTEADVGPTSSGCASVEAEWTPGTRGPVDLVQVSVFDSRSASVYVTEESAVAYLPHGTDLFPRLVSVVEAVRGGLEQEVAEIDRSRDRFESISPGSRVYEILSNLHAPGSRDLVDRVAAVSDEDRRQLIELRDEERRLKAEDPAAKAIDLRRCATRLSDACARLTVVESALDSSGIADLKSAREAVDVARAAAELASSRAFADAPLDGVGSEPWQELWRAARAFAEHGMTSPRAFPVGPADDSRCVLCQQPLSDNARDRMERFEDFVRGETRLRVERAIAELQRLVRRLSGLDPDGIADKVLLEEIGSLDVDLVPILTEAFSKLVACRDGAVEAANAPEAPSEWNAFVHAPTEARGRLERLSENLAAEAKRYDAAVDAEALKRVQNAIQELEARIALEGLRDRAHSEIARQERKALLKKAIASTNTTGITRRNTELLRQAVTEPLAEAFAANVRALSLTHLPIGVSASGGEKGRAFHALELDESVAGSVPTEEVLSEGEHRGVALAAFLAEISLQESASTVVFDDPVSSMDHGRREFVARQIVEIGGTRPVLVFTHDLVFLLLLQREADRAKVPVAPRYFRRDGARAGLVVEDWPWDGQTVKKRIGALKQTVAGFQKLAATDRPKYEAEVRQFYDRLRTTWERAVEEVLFNNAIRRFGREVQTQRLKNLHRLTERHLHDLEAGMTRVSEWIGAHDHAGELSLPVPEPDEAATDLAALETWVSEVREQVQT